MKKPLTIIALSCALVTTQAQQIESTNSTTIGTTITGPASDFLSFISASSNLMCAAYGIVSTDGKKYGGGIGLGFRVSDLVVPTLRLDYYDQKVWMPSANLQLQLPLHLGGNTNITYTPFTFAGVATPLSGKGDDNGEPVGMLGIGAAVRIGKHWGLIADFEHWTGFDADQLRFGAYFRF